VRLTRLILYSVIQTLFSAYRVPELAIQVSCVSLSNSSCNISCITFHDNSSEHILFSESRSNPFAVQLASACKSSWLGEAKYIIADSAVNPKNNTNTNIIAHFLITVFVLLILIYFN